MLKPVYNIPVHKRPLQIMQLATPQFYCQRLAERKVDHEKSTQIKKKSFRCFWLLCCS